MSIHLSIKNARIHQTRLLLEIGASPNTPDHDSRTPLMLACLIDKEAIGVRIIRMLIDHGAKISACDKHGRTALSYACMAGKEKIVTILLDDIEYDINAKDGEGNTPLMYAAMSGNASALRSILNVLVKYRLSVDLRNNKGFSAYLLAVKMGHFYCAHILKAEGFASDGIRDSEYFLNDKEWIKKARKEISLMQLQEKESPRLLTSRSVPNKGKKLTRPHTSIEFTRVSAIQTPYNNHRPRPGTRHTTRSEPARSLKYNSWVSTTEERGETSDATTSEGGFSFSMISGTEKTESIPPVARTQTPDLHAILSQYLDQEKYQPVKLPTRNCPRVTFADVADMCNGKTNQGTKPKKAGRGVLSRQGSRKNLFSH